MNRALIHFSRRKIRRRNNGHGTLSRPNGKALDTYFDGEAAAKLLSKDEARRTFRLPWGATRASRSGLKMRSH